MIHLYRPLTVLAENNFWEVQSITLPCKWNHTILSVLSVSGTEAKISSCHWPMPYITAWLIPRDTAKTALQILHSKHMVLCGSNSTK